MGDAPNTRSLDGMELETELSTYNYKPVGFVVVDVHDIEHTTFFHGLEPNPIEELVTVQWANNVHGALRYMKDQEAIQMAEKLATITDQELGVFEILNSPEREDYLLKPIGYTQRKPAH